MAGVRTRVLHLSDLHFGTHAETRLEPGLESLIERVDPELIIASGDLTHRGRAAQHDRAAAFLQGLGRPVLAVPGNHDIPYRPIARFTRTWKQFERHWETTEPVYRSDVLFVVGLNSVRPWLQQGGRLRSAQLARAAELLPQAPPTALRVVVLHHHLLGAPWRSRKKPVARRSAVLAALVDAGAELILAGHIHQAAVSERHEFEVVSGEIRGATVSIAPGLGQPRPNRRGEARGLLVYECEEEALTVETYIWREDDWGLTAVRRFPRGRAPLAAQPAPA
ncbi:MAG TPA: metallophosphoesterase [Gaiellaceae bacterium]|nr:metallophosphoesterase [Gaiellaceae bacterium]